MPGNGLIVPLPAPPGQQYPAAGSDVYVPKGLTPERASALQTMFRWLAGR